MFYSVETKRLLIWKCQRHYLIITRIITSKWDNFSKSDKNLSTFVSTLANFWKFFVRNTSRALYHFSLFSLIDYFSPLQTKSYFTFLFSNNASNLKALEWHVVVSYYFCIQPFFEIGLVIPTRLFQFLRKVEFRN